MTEYYVKLTKVGSENLAPLFVGPFKQEKLATDEIDRARAYGQMEILMDGENPQNVKNAIKTEIFTKVPARKEGLRSPNLGDEKENTLIGNKIPDTIESLMKYYEKGYGLLPEEEKRGRGRPPKVKDEAQSQPLTETSAQPQQPVKAMMTYESNTVYDYGDDLPQLGEDEDYLIVTTRQGNVEWLRRRGIVGQVVDRVRYGTRLEGRVVIGSLHPGMLSAPKRYGYVDLPGLRRDQRGEDLTADEMDEANARLCWLVVKDVTEEVEARLRNK